MRDQSTLPLETVPAARRSLLFAALILYAFSFQGTRGIWEPDPSRSAEREVWTR